MTWTLREAHPFICADAERELLRRLSILIAHLPPGLIFRRRGVARSPSVTLEETQSRATKPFSHQAPCPSILPVDLGFRISRGLSRLSAQPVQPLASQGLCLDPATQVSRQTSVNGIDTRSRPHRVK